MPYLSWLLLILFLLFPAPVAGQAVARKLRVLSPLPDSLVRTARVRFRLAQKNGPTTPHFQITVDGVETSSRGITVVSAESPALAPDETAYQIDVEIPPRSCVVGIREAGASEAPPVLVPLRWEGAPSDARPTLYVLAIGVSAYKRSELSLRFPAKDARDFADALRAQEGILYGKVVIDLLIDEMATQPVILQKMAELEQRASVRDVAVLFLAGHGITEPESGSYYFLAHDADPENAVATMISQQQIQATLRRQAGKALLFLDTCHSGSVFPEWRTRTTPDARAFAQELSSAENGVIVFSAATGRQLSKEADVWNNGAFTKALVEGLRGRAAFYAQRPITVNMLELYVSERVKELTSGLQTPSVAKPASVPDFPLAVLPANADSKDRGAIADRGTAKAPLWKQWWLWTSVGAVVTGIAIGVGVGLTR